MANEPPCDWTKVSMYCIRLACDWWKLEEDWPTRAIIRRSQLSKKEFTGGGRSSFLGNLNSQLQIRRLSKMMR